VGKKFISLLACSIRTVYKGVLDAESLAAALVTATKATMLLTATSINICFLSMVSPPSFFESIT
jgi:hypothetical protein